MTRPPPPKPRVLLVTGEPRDQDQALRSVGRDFEVVRVVGAGAALDYLAALGQRGDGERCSLLITPLELRGMGGVELMIRARRIDRELVPLLIAGRASVRYLVRAINEGQVHRVLPDPCPPEELLEACRSAHEAWLLATSQRELLEETLRGAIQTLTDVLALAMPSAFGRAERVAENVGEMARVIGREDAWVAEVSAMLSQLGCASLPVETLDRLNTGKALSPREEAMLKRAPAVATQLLEPIPRLEEVKAIIDLHRHRYDGEEHDSGPKRKDLPWGARALKIALDYDQLTCQELRPDLALSTLRGRRGAYDPELIDLLGGVVGARNDHVVVREIPLARVRPDMTFVQDVRLPRGGTLVTHGQTVTASILERIRNMTEAVQETVVRVTVPVRGLAETMDIQAAPDPTDTSDPQAIPALDPALLEAPPRTQQKRSARDLRISQFNLEALGEIDPFSI